MQPFDFNFNRSKMEQFTLVLNQGIQVAERNDGQHRYFLYYLESFYVEARFHIEARGIQDAKALSYTEIPDSYLEQIHINELLD